MSQDKNPFSGFLTLTAITGNSLFVLWILYNGINENFEGTLLEKISYIGLMVLLVLNTILLLRKK